MCGIYNMYNIYNMHNIYKETATRCALFIIRIPTSEIIHYHHIQSPRNTTHFLAVRYHAIAQLLIMTILWIAHLVSLQLGATSILNSLACRACGQHAVDLLGVIASVIADRVRVAGIPEHNAAELCMGGVLAN